MMSIIASVTSLEVVMSILDSPLLIHYLYYTLATGSY